MAAGIILLALNLRIAVAEVPPVLRDLSLSDFERSLLVAIPVVCFSLAAFAGPPLSARLGEERVLLAMCLALCAGPRAAPMVAKPLFICGHYRVRAGGRRDERDDAQRPAPAVPQAPGSDDGGVHDGAVDRRWPGRGIDGAARGRSGRIRAIGPGDLGRGRRLRLRRVAAAASPSFARRPHGRRGHRPSEGLPRLADHTLLRPAIGALLLAPLVAPHHLPRPRPEPGCRRRRARGPVRGGHRRQLRRRRCSRSARATPRRWSSAARC